ncbi:NADPH-dependent FMN reductase [Pedobacter aquatilis]|uniref:NADPH-dependent FMN reductase n=1 Tax=Pedobacter aquatilis TaxID=351343 RepID=UPI00292CAA31|nr:NADPH-dependent FMN reductase [Pedobacter aquatilis]
MKTIFAICGSTRSQSSNLQVIKAIENLLPGDYSLTLFENISLLPHFNPDLDNELTPDLVSAFRQNITKADGILFCTPEYAMGLPGTFKNAIDWTVTTASLSKKPVFAIIASSQGEMAFDSLAKILTVLEVDPIMQLIPFVRSKVNLQNEITDTETLETTQANVSKFINQIERPTSI